jgi:hypothetical protein
MDNIHVYYISYYATPSDKTTTRKSNDSLYWLKRRRQVWNAVFDELTKILSSTRSFYGDKHTAFTSTDPGHYIRHQLF